MAWTIALILLGNWVVGFFSGAELGLWLHGFLLGALLAALVGALNLARQRQGDRPPPRRARIAGERRHRVPGGEEEVPDPGIEPR